MMMLTSRVSFETSMPRADIVNVPSTAQLVTATLRTDLPCTRGLHHDAPLDTVQSGQRSLEGGAEIYATGSWPKGGYGLTTFLADRTMFSTADHGDVQGWVIPTPTDQNRCAQSRIPMD